MGRTRRVLGCTRFPSQARAVTTITTITGLLPTCRPLHNTLSREAGRFCQTGREGHRASFGRIPKDTAKE